MRILASMSVRACKGTHESVRVHVGVDVRVQVGVDMGMCVRCTCACVCDYTYASARVCVYVCVPRVKGVTSIVPVFMPRPFSFPANHEHVILSLPTNRIHSVHSTTVLHDRIH